MIVDFVQIKNKLDKIANEHLMFFLERKAGFLNQIDLHIIHEGHAQTYQTVDNETVEQSLKLIQSSYNLSYEEIKKLKISDILKHVEEIAAELAEQQRELALQRMKEEVDKVGNVVDAKNKSFAESSLEMLEKMQIDFDETRDKPHLPTMIVHPDTGKKLIEEERSMSEEEKLTYEQRQQEILSRKYEEYILRESNRKLVD